MILGWTAAIGMTLAVFNGTINLQGGKMQSNRRRSSRRKSPRSSRRVRRNVGTEGWYRFGGLYRQGNWAWDGSGVEARGDLLWWSSTLARFSPVADSVTLDEANDVISKSSLQTWDAPKQNRRRSSRRVRRNATRRSSHARPKPPKFSEMAIWQAVATVRETGKSSEVASILPPGVAAKFKRLAPGLYKYGYGPKKGEVFVQFKNATLKGAMTSTRIGAKAVGEYHWVVDNFDPKFPVVIRGIDDRGGTYWRIEEHVKTRVRTPVVAKRASSRR